MNNYINLFKSDFFSGVLAVTKKTWLKVLYAYLMYYFSMLILGGLFALVAISSSIDLSFFTKNLGNPNPSQQETLLFIQQFSDMIATPEFLVPMIILFVILLVMGSWNYYFAFITTNSEVKSKNKKFGQLLRQSFSVEIFKLIGISLLLNIIIWLLFVIAIMSAGISPLLAFILFIVACVACMRFALVIPAFVVGNYNFSSSFAFSFYHITWKRALKYFGISILAMLVLMGVSLIIGLLSGLFALIPFLGIIIQTLVNIAFGAIMMAVMTSIMVGLFYRYSEVPKTEESTEIE
ncbi:MAG: hypothetical protein P1U41_02355 [Vicingaceae bacterium]|nr:hypothetical protein [Vicingaceae bacterium]